MDQVISSGAQYSFKKRKTRREKHLDQMKQIILSVENSKSARYWKPKKPATIYTNE